MSMENAMSKKLNGRGGRFVLLAAALSFAWGLRADTATFDGYTYTYSVTDGKATIESDKAESPAISPYPVGTVMIPSELGGYPVVGLGTNALYKCMNLTEVVLPDSVTTIGRLAFGSCTRLTTLSIPNSVTNIDVQAFYRCYRLESFSVAPDNKIFSSQDGLLLSKDRTVLIQGISGRVDIPPCVVRIGDCAFYNGSLTEVTIPSSVTNIGQNAFFECNSLRNVVIPDSVTKIENWTFNRCSGLTSVSLPNSVMHIGDAAFYQCYNLEDVTIPAGVTNIGTLAFYMCRKLVNLSIPKSVRQLGGGAFYRCSGLTDVSIPNSVPRIWWLTFSECTGLTHVVIPDSVKAIDSNAFGGCTNLTSVWVPGHLKRVLPSDTFEGCNEALTVNYYDSSYTITFQQDGEPVESRQCPEGAPLGVVLPTPPTREGYVFEGWWTAADGEQASEETIVSDDVTYYAKWRGTATVDGYTYTYSVLNGQAEIGSSNAWTTAVSPKPTGHVVVPSSLGGFPVVGIGKRAFSSCFILEGVTIPEGVTAIGEDAFAYCYKLEDVTIPEGVVAIGEDAFVHCSKLEGVTIPESVTTIGQYAFQWCHGLKSVHISDLAKWCQIKFGNSDANPLYQAHELYLNGEHVTKLVIPEGVTSIGSYAFAGCSGLTEVMFPNSVTNIGGVAFMDCSGLMELALPGSVVEIGTSAFQGCSGLTEVEIPHGVKAIGGGVFSDCSSLTKITVEPGNENYVSQNGLLLTKDGKTLKEGVNGTVVIPSSVTRINNFAFSGRDSLTQVTIPNGIREIGWFAFSGCDSLTKVVIPSSVVNIEPRAFVSSGLTSIAVEEGNEFYSSRNGMLLSKDGTLLIQGVNGEVEFPPCVRMIGEMAFMECSGLTRLVIPDSVTNIASKAFAYYRGLTDAWLPRHLEGKFSANVFEDCGNMTLHYYDRAYTVTFQTEEGIVEQRQCPAGMSFDTLPPSPSRDWYTFEGWWTADGKQASKWTSASEDLTYYAKWRGTATVDDYTYTYSVLNGQAEIGTEKYGETAVSPNPTGAIVIPSMLDGYPVVSVGEYAFYKCTNVTNIEIPKGVMNIRRVAFRMCESLTNVVISSSVTNVDVHAFECCDELVNFTVDPANAVYSSRNGLLLSKDGWTLVRGVNGDVVIPSCVTEIGVSAFEECHDLETVTIPNGVLSIGKNAFQSCYSLKDMAIPQSVTNIGIRAFDICFKLRDVSVDPENRFYSSRDGLLMSKDGTVLVRGINARNDGVVIPDGVTTIGETAFERWASLANVDVPDGVTNIGRSAFAVCVSLESVTLPDSLTTIGPLAFEDCGSLTSIEVPDGVTTISEAAFCGCRSLADVTLPNSLTTIDEMTFMGCTSLTSIEIPRGVTEIGNLAFFGCTGLTSRVVIPDSVTNIEWDAFARCTGLKEVWLPRDLEERFYPDWVFRGCDEALALNYYDALYTVAFRSEDGTEEQRLCPMGVALGDLPTPVRAGAVFSGWWTADGKPVSTETVVTGDMTLEARWHVVAAPEIIPMNCNGATFWDRCYVEIMCKDRDAVIYYSTDGRMPHLTEAYRYKGVFWFDRTTTIRAIAVLDGVRSACVTATFERECSMPQYRDGSYDDDAVELTFTTGGDTGWDYSWTEDHYRYGDCLRSGLIGNEQESWLQTSVVGRGTFSFRWKVDCEYDDFGEAAWDHLAVFTNGVEAVRMDGTRGWERMSFTFDDDGRHTIRWVFVKDGYDEEDAAYEDCAWLGRFSWNPADVTVDAGKGRTVTVPGAWLGKRTMRAATDVAANGRRVWECYLLGLDPEEADDDFRIASFEVVDGVPAFTFSHTRDGSGVSFEPRIRILGKARLDDAAWTEMPEGGDPALRFFKAEVALP